MSQNALINKYRPAKFDEVMGHDTAMAALARVLASNTCPHAFLFTGPSGVGKTTTARIIGTELGCEIIEIDAASHSGVDEMKRLAELGSYASFAGDGRKLVIIDECHALSKAAWQSTLKLLEEPPEHLFLALCTTEEAKVPETVRTRCHHVLLRSVGRGVIEELLDIVCDVEGWQVAGDVMQAVVQAAEGSPRKALATLQAVHDLPNREEVKRVIGLMDDTDGPVGVVKMLVAGKQDWPLIAQAIQKLTDDEFRPDVLVGCARYVASALLASQGKGGINTRLSDLLQALVFPVASYDPKVQFIAAVCRYLTE